MSSRRLALSCAALLAGSSVLSGSAAADCGCWRYVRPESSGPGTALGEITSPASDTAWAAGSRDGAPLVYGWDGARWQETDVPLPADTLVEGVAAASPRDAWLVGYDAEGVARTARFADGAWRAGTLPGGGPAFPRAVDARTTADAWIAGSAGTSAATWHWDGTAWKPVPVPNVAGTRSELRSVSAAAADDAWAVGVEGASPPKQLVLRWDGRDWTRQTAAETTGEAALADVVTLGPRDAWAVGGTRTAGGDTPLAERWDGTAWRLVDVPGVRGRFYSVTSDGGTGIWAVGEDSTRHVVMAHWKDGSWDISTAPVPNPSGDDDAHAPAAAWSVSRIPGTHTMWAAGPYTRPGENIPHAITWTARPR